MAAGPQDDERPDARDQAHERAELRLDASEGKASPEQLVVRGAERGAGLPLHRVGAHHRHPGEMLLDDPGQHAELRLLRLRPLVHRRVDPLGEEDEHRIDAHRPEREPRIEREHRGEGAAIGQRRTHEAQAPEADELLHGGDITGGARHEIARAALGDGGGREALHAGVEVVAHVELHALRGADEGKARSEPHDAVRDREGDDEGDERAERRRRRIPLERVDRALDGPRNREREPGAGRETREPDEVPGANRRGSESSASTPRRARRQAALPAACGNSPA